MKNVENKEPDIYSSILMLLCIILFRIVNYPIISFSVLGIIASIKYRSFPITAILFAIGLIFGFIYHLIIEQWHKKFNKNYSIVVVRKSKSHEICTKIIIPDSEIDEMFLNDLQAIKKDYNKPGSYLTTKTHKLFVYKIINEFTGKLKEFYRDFNNAPIGSQRIYESEDKSVSVEVKYVKSKINISKAINKFSSWNDIKKASKKVPFYNITIKIK